MKTVIRNSYTPKIGDYCNKIVVDKETGNIYIFDTDGVFTEFGDADIDIEDIIRQAVEQSEEYTDEVAETKVDKEEGKGLSSNDFTDAEKEKLSSVEGGAEENVIEGVSVNGTPVQLENKIADIDVPTKTSDLDNDSGFITNATSGLENYYTKSEVDGAVSTEVAARQAADQALQALVNANTANITANTNAIADNTAAIAAETSDRESADQDLQSQIDAISSASDVVDVVGTYAELQQYDTSSLGANDIVKVLVDETHDDAISYYRWSGSTFTYIGSQGPFYTKSETDATFVPQTRTVNNKALSSNITLTATDVGAATPADVAGVQTQVDALEQDIEDEATARATADQGLQSQITQNATNITSLSTTKADKSELPTKTSDLTNDSGFITAAALPTKTSDLTNDSNFVSDANYVHTDNNFTTTLKNKLNGIAAGAEVNVQSDWAQTTTTADDYIKNKPTKLTDFTNDAGFITSAALPTKTSDLTNDSGFITSAALSPYSTTQQMNTAISNAVTDKADRSELPTATSDLTNDSGFITNTVNNLTNYYTQTQVNDMFAALPQVDVPTKVSELENDSGYLTTATLPVASANTPGVIKVGGGLEITNGVLSATGGGTADAVEWTNVLNKPTNVSYWTNDAGYITSADIPSIPSKTSDLTNDSGFITNSVNNLTNYYTKSQTYTQSEVNSLVNAITVPTKTSDLTNDGADGTSTYVEAADLATVATSGSYNDLSNKPTIPAAQVNSDWNATSGKAQILNKPTKLSQFTNDSGFITGYTETDPIYSASPAAGITAEDIESWDNKSDFSGSYNDLTNKPTIGNATLTIQKNGTAVDTFTANATSNKTINITVPTTAADVSALPASTKYGASISVSLNTTDYKMTTTLKDQDGNTLGTAQTVDLPLESVVVNGSYDSTNKKIVLTLQNGNTVDIPVGDLIAGLQTEITSTNKLSSDLVDDTNHTHKFVTAAQITKLNGIAAGAEVNVQSDWNVTDTTSDAFIKNKPTIPTVNNATLTIQKNGTNVQTFTANQSTNATANITVPTKTSDITNDSGFITSSSLDSYLPLSGGILTGNVGINELDNGGTYFHVKDSSQGTALSFGVGSGHVNHGIWSNTLNKWMLYGDATNVHLNGNANTATSATSAGKLTTPRTIGIGTGGTGTATSFNGTANITIPLTDVKDSYVTWGGKSLAANVTPDDMGCIDEFGHNKLAFLPAECITVEYTTDGGTTWTDYGATDAQKVRMVSTTGTSFMAGGPTAVPTADNIADFKVRVRVASMTPSGTSKLYSAMVKCLLNITTNGASGTKVAIRSRTVANYKAGVDTWVNRGEFDIGGWSGWNSIPFNYTFGGTSDSQLAQFEFVFWGTGKHANYNSKVAVIDIRMIGRTNWTTPSEMARAGHLYTADESQDATFPAKVIAPKIETGTGANNYFQSQKFRGQGDASSYYHAIDFGYGGHDHVDFYEYGGAWNFWKNTSATATTDVNNLALGITLNALKNKSYTYTFPNKTGTFALTSDIPTVPTNVSEFTNDAGYLTSIPKASASTLGGIKVGNNLTISSDGTLSANASSVTVDSALSSTSTNPVQNKVINTALNGKQASLSTAQLNAANSGITSAKVTTYDGYASQIATKADLSALDDKQDALTAGDHIDITNDVISATGYVHSENPVTTTSSTATVTGSMIANGTITADKLATGATLKLTLSTTDIGEGAALAANTLYGVYQ